MYWLIVILSLLLVFLGLESYLIGRHGRRVDDHPVCRTCGYDLFGRNLNEAICPECGSYLRAGIDIRFGNRRPRQFLLFTGLSMIVFGAVPLALLVWLGVRGIELIQLKPLPWLIKAVAVESPTNFTAGDSAELLRRIKGGKLSASDVRTIVAKGLALQADLTKPWNPRWGDMIELLQTQGKLSNADWSQYLLRNKIVTLAVQPKNARGDPIRFKMDCELRGASPLMDARPGREPRFSATVPGVNITVTIAEGDCSGEGWHYRGFVALNENRGAPSLFAPTWCRQQWSLVSNGEMTLEVVHDENLAARIEKILSCHATTDGDQKVIVEIKAPMCPVNLAYDVNVRIDQSDWAHSPQAIWIRKDDPDDRRICVFSHVPFQRGQKMDVILLPSISGAAETIAIDRLLDHKFVFKDVLGKTP
jgi:hypothetical protein